MSNSKFRQEQAINMLENLSDQISHVIDLMLSRRDVISQWPCPLTTQPQNWTDDMHWGCHLS